MSEATHVRDDAGARKARGAFFTPPALCDHLTSWAIRSADDAVLEPSCGDARFLLSAAARMRTFGARDPHLVGIELHTQSASHAADRLREVGIAPRIDVGDFFARTPEAAYDAVVGNPPYVRYQGFGGEARTAAREAALAAGVRLTALASSWAAFTVHAALFLRPQGRLGLVLPAELLSVNYAAEVRAFLMKRFAIVRLVVFTERVFPGVQEEVVLLQAEGAGGTDHCELHQVRDLEELVARTPTVSRWKPAEPRHKWTDALVDDAARAAYARAASHQGAAQLHDWGETTLGAVTGHNRYFTLTADDIADGGFASGDVVTISPPGSTHLRALLDLGDAEWTALAAAGHRTWLLCPQAEPSRAAMGYLSDGMRDGVHLGYKCRMRDPWWRTPLPAVPDLLLTYMNADGPRLVSNSAGVHHINSVHGVYLHPDHAEVGARHLPMAALNSMTLLGAEIVGRAYGGGLLKLEPREADVLPVPSPVLVSALSGALEDLRGEVQSLLATRRVDDAVAAVDEVLLHDGMGLDREDVGQLRAARTALRARRMTRGRSRT